MSITNTLKHIAENSNGEMIVEKVPASKQPSAETINKIESEISAMIRENDKVAYDSMHPRKNYYSTGVKNGKIENFEERYAKLLEGINEEELIPLPNPHKLDIVTSLDEIDHLEDGFIARYCLGDIADISKDTKFSLDKKGSNKVAKVVTAIVLATGLSLSNPINVNASDNTKSIESTTPTNPLLFGCVMGFIVIGSILLGVKTIKQNQQDNDIEFIVTKLDKTEEKEEVKQLKLVNDEEVSHE